jgi:SAM-dependent methyltransferase
VGGSPVAGAPAIENLIRSILKPAQLSVHDQERFVNGEGDVYLSARDRERLLRAIHKPVQDVKRPDPSRWERSHVYWSLTQRFTRLLFERDLGTAGQTIEVEHLDPDLVPYEPSSWLPLRWALRRLRPGPDDVFVDFGCGKGRVICEAAKRPFARVVGVEISPRLVEAAQANVERNRESFKCQDIELVTANAAEWQVPDNMTIAYLYHPFTGEVFDRVIDNVVQSVVRSPRRFRLVYVGPVLEEEILKTGYFRLVRRRRGRGSQGKIFNSVALFEHDPGRDRFELRAETNAAGMTAEASPRSGASLAGASAVSAEGRQGR